MASYPEIVGINDVDITGQSHGAFKLENNELKTIFIEFSDINLKVESIKTQMQDLNGVINWQNEGALQKI